MNKILASLFISASMLSSAAHAQGQGSPASERMCFLLAGLAGGIGDEREKGTKMEELMPLFTVLQEPARSDQIAVLKYIYEKKLNAMDARKDVYFRCMVGDYKSAWKL